MGFPRALVSALAAKLRTDVPGLAAVYEEWPDANQQIVYPSVSILSGNPVYNRIPPYLLQIGSVVNNRATNLYVVGEFDIGLQLDIWTKYKIQRDQIYDLVWKVLEPATAKGLTLTLTDYYNEKITITQTGYKFPDTPLSVSQKEWRVLVQLIATSRAISETQEFVITQAPVLVFDTPATIETEE